jgi:thiol-disulfide isomerase/thioredoxin
MSSAARARNRRGRSAAAGANRTWFVIIGIVVVLGIAAVVAVASGRGDGTAAKATGHETGAVAISGKPLAPYEDPNEDAAIGATIPTITGVNFEGEPVTVGPNGKPQTLIFLSHSCPHCQAEVPRIVELERAGKLAGVDVTAIATNTNPDYQNYPPSAWLKREHWAYPVLVDNKSSSAAAAFGLPAFPYFVFVDGEGRVLLRAAGELAPESLTKIFKTLAEGGSPTDVSNGASTSAN